MTLGDDFSNMDDINEVLDLIADIRNQIHEDRALEHESETESLMHLYENHIMEPSDL